MDTIIRVEKNRQNPYVIIRNSVFEDPRISWKAKGLMGYFLSRPNDWQIRVTDLIQRSTDGRDSVYAIIRELKATGYVKEVIRRDAHGHIRGREYLVFEVSSLDPENPEEVTAPLDPAFPDQVKPDQVKPTLLITEKEPITKKTTTTSPDVESLPSPGVFADTNASPSVVVVPHFPQETSAPLGEDSRTPPPGDDSQNVDAVCAAFYTKTQAVLAERTAHTLIKKFGTAYVLEKIRLMSAGPFRRGPVPWLAAACYHNYQADADVSAVLTAQARARNQEALYQQRLAEEQAQRAAQERALLAMDRAIEALPAPQKQELTEKAIAAVRRLTRRDPATLAMGKELVWGQVRRFYQEMTHETR